MVDPKDQRPPEDEPLPTERLAPPRPQPKEDEQRTLFIPGTGDHGEAAPATSPEAAPAQPASATGEQATQRFDIGSEKTMRLETGHGQEPAAEDEALPTQRLVTPPPVMPEPEVLRSLESTIAEPGETRRLGTQEVAPTRATPGQGDLDETRPISPVADLGGATIPLATPPGGYDATPPPARQMTPPGRGGATASTNPSGVILDSTDARGAETTNQQPGLIRAEYAPSAQFAPLGEEHLEKAYSLAPENAEQTPGSASSLPETSFESTHSTPVRKGLWLSAGLLAALAVSGWLFFKPWPARFSMAAPRMAELPAAPEDVPRNWRMIEGGFIGGDRRFSWLYDPADSTKALRETLGGAAPVAAEAATAVVVGRPPLEPSLHLAWIESSTGGPPRLTMPPKLPIPLEEGRYLFAPVVADHPTTRVGLTLLLAANDPPRLGAWPAAIDRNTTSALWEVQFSSPILRPPLVWLDLREAAPRMWALVLTAAGLHVIDIADPLGPSRELAWPDPFPVDALPTIGRMRRDGQEAWIVTDGHRLLGFSLGADGQPAAVELGLEGFAETSRQARLLSFPSVDDPSRDELVLISGGKMIWTRADQDGGPLRDAPAPPGEPVAMDLNGDGYWDLVSLAPAGELSVIDGATRAPLGGGAHAAQTYPPPHTPVAWRLDETGGNVALHADYIDQQGQPRRLELPLPAKLRRGIDALRADWRWRREFASANQIAGQRDSANATGNGRSQ